MGGGNIGLNGDLLFQIPLGKIALGVYVGTGIGVLWTEDQFYSYVVTIKRLGIVKVPFGVSLAFGRSRIELGAMGVVGRLEEYSFEKSLAAGLLSYQIVF
ncbi:hypothetical protein [Helicobacter sp. 12S02634-8]|uniref:hypothetical protein n=1 Tax=Helicobacter sp. 12S02634-8 TaxID=1476199 RepID=UPI001179F2E4|nr:hypothetical protein [Helicobacter sp. 12S02634-8]